MRNSFIPETKEERDRLMELHNRPYVIPSKEELGKYFLSFAEAFGCSEEVKNKIKNEFFSVNQEHTITKESNLPDTGKV